MGSVKSFRHFGHAWNFALLVTPVCGRTNYQNSWRIETFKSHFLWLFTVFSFTFRWLSGSQRREQLEMIIAGSQSLVMQWGQHEARPVIPIVSHCVLTVFFLTDLSISHKQLKNKLTIRMIPHPVQKKQKHFWTILNRNVKETKVHFKF